MALEPSQAMWPMMLTFNADRLLDRHRIASVIHRSPSRIRLMPSFKSELQNPSIAGPDSPSGLYSLDGRGGPSDGVRMYGFLILWRQIDHNWVVNLIEAARRSKITSLLCVWRIFIYTMVSMLIHSTYLHNSAAIETKSQEGIILTRNPWPLFVCWWCLFS